MIAIEQAPTAPKRAAAGLGAWWALTVLTLLLMLSFVDRYMLSMLVDPIKADLGLTDFQMSLALGPAFGVSYAVFGLPLGWMADRYPRRWIIFVGVTFWSLATAATALSRGFTSIFLARAGIAIGEASLAPSAYSLLADKFPRERLATATSIYMAGAKMGSAVAFGVGGLAIGLATAATTAAPDVFHGLHAWQLVFLMVGAPGLILAAMVFTFSEPARKNQVSVTGDLHSAAEYKAYVKSRWSLYLLMALGFTLVSMYVHAMIAWTPTYIGRQFHWTPAQYGPLLGLMNATSAFVFVFKGAILDWLAARGMKDAPLRFYTWLIVLSSPAIAAIFLVDSPIIFLALYAVLQLVAMPYTFYIALTVQLAAPNQFRGQTTAAFFFVINIIASVGATVVAALTDFVFKDDQKLGYSLMLVSVTMMPAAFVVLRLALRPLRRAIEDMEGQLAAAAKAERAPGA